MYGKDKYQFNGWLTMRITEIDDLDPTEMDLTEDEFNNASLDYKHGQNQQAIFKSDELEHELGHEDRVKTRQKMRDDLPRDYYKIPFAEKALANKHKLVFDSDRKLWYKTWYEGIRVDIPELNKYRWSIYSNKFLVATPPTSDNKPVIVMTALHYWDMNDATATGVLLADIKIRQDKNGKWYLPEYNTSGEKFLRHLKELTEKLGEPKTVILHKR